ncbi:MAG: hypothetical protein Q4F05_03590 [bacterium]|nr:hypothetical protein [bacterium]
MEDTYEEWIRNNNIRTQEDWEQFKKTHPLPDMGIFLVPPKIPYKEPKSNEKKEEI